MDVRDMGFWPFVKTLSYGGLICIGGQWAARPDRMETSTILGALYAFPLWVCFAAILWGLVRLLPRPKRGDEAQE